MHTPFTLVKTQTPPVSLMGGPSAAIAHPVPSGASSNATGAPVAGSKRKSPMPPTPLAAPALPVSPAPVSLPKAGQVVVFTQGKGGSGKSILTREASAAYAKLHPEQTCLVIDFDRQGHQKYSLNNKDQPIDRSFSELWLSDQKSNDILKIKIDAARLKTHVANLTVMMGTPDAVDELETHIGKNTPKFETVFKKIFKLLTSQFDVIFVDTQGALNSKALEFAMKYADACIVPVNYKDESVKAELISTLEKATDVKEAIDKEAKVGFIFNMVHGKTYQSTINTQMNQLLKTTGEREGNLHYLGSVSKSDEIMNATNRNCPLVVSNEQHHVAQELMGIAKKIDAFLKL